MEQPTGPKVRVILEHRDDTPRIEGTVRVAEGLTPPVGFHWMPSLVTHKGKAYKLLMMPAKEPYIYLDVQATEVEAT